MKAPKIRIEVRGVRGIGAPVPLGLEWLQINLDEELIAELRRLQSVVIEHELNEARILRVPQGFGPQEAVKGMSCGISELAITALPRHGCGFWFESWVFNEADPGGLVRSVIQPIDPFLQRPFSTKYVNSSAGLPAEETSLFHAK